MDREEIEKQGTETVNFAVSEGADTAEVSINESTEFEINIRNGEIENLTESISSRITASVSVDQRQASVTSSDLSHASIKQLIREAIQLAKVMDRDEFFGLPDRKELSKDIKDLEISDEEIIEMPLKKKIERTKRLEEMARRMDKRIISEGAFFFNSINKISLANSLGFRGYYTNTICQAGISCAAKDENSRGSNIGKKQADYWYSAATSMEDLEPVDEIASRVVNRTLRKVGAVRPKTCEVPVVFDTSCASNFLSSISQAVNGKSIYMQSSFLTDSLNQKIGSPLVNVIDDPLMPGKLGTRPFDSEGVKSRKNVIIKDGYLKSYLLNCYQARKLGLRTTGSGGGESNFYLQPGEKSCEDIIAEIDRGLYVTSISGPGANWSTGDFSQGAQGLWIEGGKLSYPVDEFTIASTFQKMLEGITEIANDILWNSSTTSPTFKVENMTVSGT
jgi:PmbA protein